MKKYQAYKDSGIEWIGEIPEHWIQYKIKFVIAKKGYKAGPFGSSLITGDLLDFGDYKIFTPEHVAEKKISEEWYLPNERINEMSQFMVNDNDVVLPIVGTLGLAKVFKTSIDGKGIINQRLAKLTCDDKKISSQFLCLTLMGVSNYQEYFKLQSRGAILSHLNKETIVSMPIVLPSIEEQAKIINYINYRTSKIELLIEKKQQLIKLLKEERTAIIYNAVTKGINPNVKLKDSGVEWIGAIPEHWEITRLKFLGKAFGGLTYSPKDIVQDHKEGKLVLRSSNIQKGKISLNDNIYVNSDISGKLTLRLGDILICSRNGSQKLIGKNICIDEAMVGNTFGAFMMVFRSNYWLFLKHFFNSSIFSSQSGLFLTATINQLTSHTINNFVIAFPKSLEEQNEISLYIDNKITKIDKIVLKTEKEIELMKEYKTALISEVVTGKIDVREEVLS